MHRNVFAGARRRLDRRSFLRGLGAVSALGLAGGIGSRAALAGEDGPKLLFVVAASGGASIVDSFLPVSRTEAGSAAPNIIAYADGAIEQVPGAAFRCVRNLGGTDLFNSDYELSTFVRRHMADMVVATQEVTSVNHVVAQRRAITGAGIHGGRTIQEATAERHGASLALPNVDFASGGYATAGDDGTVAGRSLPELVSDPLLFPLSTHGSLGVRGAPSQLAIDQARRARASIEGASTFLGKHGPGHTLSGYLARRGGAAEIEASDAIRNLMLLDGAGDATLEAYGLAPSPYRARLLEVFPSLARGDALEAQAAVGFLLARYGMSCAITIGLSDIPSFTEEGAIVDTPLAFDFSHVDHVTAQNTMWARMMKVVDGLVTLLKEEDYLGVPELGKMWDRSLVYVATDFGRTKTRPSDSSTFGSGHDFTNGNVLVSPLLEGNRVFGSVDPRTCHTSGFDGATGDPDAGAPKREGDIYSAVAHALDIELAGRTDMSALVRGA
jgi:hypothetical protein